LDTAVYLYHAERGYVLAIFNAILEAAKDVSIENSIRYVFSSFMGDIVKEKPSSGSSFINKIITSAKHLSKMSSTISKDGMLESGKKAAENQQRLRDAKYREEFEKQHHRQLFDHAIMQPDEPLVFKPETIKLRVDQLDEERITLMQILYYISTLYWLPEDDLIAILTKVQSMNLSDNNASYMLTALLAALSFEYTSPPNSRQGVNFSTNNTFLKKLHDQITTKTWKVDALKAVVSIQWALFVQVLYRTKPDIDQALSFNKNARISLVKSAIALDAFGYMNNYLLHFKQKLEARDRKQTIKDINDDDSAMALDGLIVDPNDYTKFNVDISDDFQRFVVHELETLTESFIFNMSDIFSHLKSKASGEEMMESQASNDLKEEINNTFIKFLALLASIYRNRRDAGLKFWNNERLSYFLAFLADLKLPGNLHLPATFDFMGSISTGVESADYSYAKFKIGTNTNNIGESSSFSWGKLFSAYQFFNKEFQKHKSEDMPPIFSALEEEMLIKFSYLCQQVVQYSNDGRKELWSSPVLAAHSSIVELIACPLSSQFRAALYDLLAAFTSHWGGGINDVGKSCAKDVWMTLERSDMIISNKVMVRQEPATAASTTTTITPSANTLYNGYSIITPVSTVSSSTPPNPVQKYLLPEQPAGFLRVFEDEKNLRVYTETQSVLHLMANLIHTPSKRDELINAFSLIEPSVPYLLGHDNNRTPGTSPYISLVVDHVFLNLKNLKYDNPDTQWQLADACLTIIENSIMSFNIEPLCDYIRYTSSDNKMTVANVLGGASPQAASIKQSTLQDSLLTYVTQPGYDVLVGILSGNALVHELFKIVAKGKEAIAQSKTDENDYFRKCLTRCLRIFSKVFKIQNAFVNIFMPQLHITSTKQEMGQFKLGDYVFPSPPSSLRSLGSLMLFNTEVIVQMAVLVDSDDYEDICALSVSVLADLASQPEDCSSDTQLNNHINAPMGGIGSRQLAGILLSSPKASSIIFGVSERLEVETAERTTYDDYEYDMNIIPFWLAEKTLGNIYRFDDFNDNYHPSRSIRITILDMLLKNMGKELQSPTITEFLLGYDVKDLETFGVQRKSIPTDVQHRSQLACLLAILEMLRRGTDDDENYDGEQEIPLIRTHPVLAERCYQLIFKLCATESTSTATLYYLRTNCDDFLVKQFKSIACRLETCVGVSEPCFEGTLVSADKTVVSTDFLTMVSVLNQRAWLLKLIALELHMTANTSHRNGTVTLLELLYGIADHSTSPAIEDILVQQMESMKLQLDTNYQQPLWNMLEIVNSLEFTWNDALDEGPAEPLVYFRTFTAEKYKTQKDGYALYDIRTVYKILRQHQLTDPFCASLADGERHAMEAEMGRILKRLTAENHHLEINYGRLHCLRAWKQVVEITISDCFDLFSFGSREKIIYDLLTVLLPKLEYGSGLNNEILKGLSEIVLSLLKRLREDKRRQEILQVAPGSVAAQFRLPDEKLRLIFTSIINCICKVTIEIRSSMYSSLVNLLQYISPNVSTQQNDASFRNIRSDIINIVGGECKGKLLDTICGDANNALAIYNTTAFMALQALYDLLSKNKDTMIHQYLVKKNFLQYNVDMIKQSDFELNKIIQERDGTDEKQ
jgi:nuclear pore complex protein Nup205